MSKYLAGAGWYEFISYGTSYTIQIFEDGSFHLPATETTIDNFTYALSTGEAWRLIRTDPLVEVRPNLRLTINEM